MVQEARRMWRRGGITPFLFGLQSRVLRDVMFGAVYSGFRQQGGKRKPESWDSSWWEFAVNTASATLATVLSGPFNYVQNLQFVMLLYFYF